MPVISGRAGDRADVASAGRLRKRASLGRCSTEALSVAIVRSDIERQIHHCEQWLEGAIRSATGERPMNEHAPRAKFRSMDEGTAEDWATIGGHFFPYAKELPDRVLTHLKLLDG